MFCEFFKKDFNNSEHSDFADYGQRKIPVFAGDFVLFNSGPNNFLNSGGRICRNRWGLIE